MYEFMFVDGDVVCGTLVRYVKMCTHSKHKTSSDHDVWTLWRLGIFSHLYNLLFDSNTTVHVKFEVESLQERRFLRHVMRETRSNVCSLDEELTECQDWSCWFFTLPKTWVNHNFAQFNTDNNDIYDLADSSHIRTWDHFFHFTSTKKVNKRFLSVFVMFFVRLLLFYYWYCSYTWTRKEIK